MHLNQVIDPLLDLFYPPECVITGDLPDVEGYRYLSKAGLDALHIVSPPYCYTCGFPFFGMINGPRDCPHCRELEAAYRDGRTLLLLNDAGRKLIHLLKYHHGSYLIPDIIQLAQNAPAYLKFIQGAVLIPVPLAARKERERGYNQSMLIADALAKATSSKAKNLLRRILDTPTQTSLKREEREKNVRQAFIVTPSITLNPEIRYIIVDDVFTTGATLNACARTLIDAGAEHVDVVTLGHG